MEPKSGLLEKIARRGRRGSLIVPFFVMLVLSILLMVPTMAWATATPSADEVEFVRLLNEYRAANGAGPLLISDALSLAAYKHNRDMATYKFFSHTTVNSNYFPVGSQPWDRMRAVGYNYNTTMAENLAGGYPTAAEAFKAWKNSAGHNRNMLDPAFKVIGVSLYFVADTAYGYFWTTDFGGYVDPSAHSPSTGPAPAYSTIAGPDRYATAIMISQKAYPKGAPAAFVVKGDNFPDALAAAPLATAYGGPVILTPSTGLTQVVKDELKRLNPREVFHIGLPVKFEAELQALLPNATIKSVRGKDRYETATLLADELKKKRGLVEKVVVVPGDNFPDALSAAPLAASKGWAIMLTPASGPMPEVTSAKIKELGIGSALVVGNYVKPPATVKDVVYKVGKDRYDTAAQIAVYAKSQGLSFAHVALVTGENYPDALVVGPYLVPVKGILLLTRPTRLPTYINEQLLANRDGIEKVDFVGLPSGVAGETKTLLQ